MLQKILKAFPYSPDGMAVTMLVAGDEENIRDDLVQGLRDAGLVGDPDPVAEATDTETPPLDPQAQADLDAALAAAGFQPDPPADEKPKRGKAE